MLNWCSVEMNITGLRSPQHPDSGPIEKLSSQPGLSEEEKLAEASRQFESLLLRQILGQARKTVFASKLNDDSVASGIYRDMVTEQLAQGISQSGEFGLARSLETQLQHQAASTKNSSGPSSSAPEKTH